MQLIIIYFFQVLFIAMGFQMKDIDDISSELGLPASQILAKFYEACKKINAGLNAILESTVAKEIGIDDKNADEVNVDGPVKESLQEELSKAAKVICFFGVLSLGLFWIVHK